MMKIGFRCTEGGQRFEEALTEVKHAEAEGFDSAWVSEHHGWDVKWPASYIALAGFATATEEIELGVGLNILPQTNPVALGGAANLVDLISNGRFILGVGTGWRRDEMENLGYDFDTRGSRMTDHLRALNELWDTDSATYDGQFVSFEEFNLEPESIRDPRPPIWVGGGSTPALKRAARHGDGWLPSWKEPFDDLKSKYEEYDKLLTETDSMNEALRSRPLLRVACVHEDSQVARDRLRDLLSKMIQKYRRQGWAIPAEWEEALEGDFDPFARDLFIYGDPEECIAQLKRYHRELGIDHAILKLATPTSDHEDILDAIDLLGETVISEF